MIPANELRIGNVFWEDYGGYKIVTGINCNKHGEVPNTVLGRGLNGTLSGLFDCEHIHPVKITKAVLYELGATEFSSGPSLLLNNRLIEYAECRDEYFDQSTSVTLKSVHQIQNLHFLLSGKELEYSPK